MLSSFVLCRKSLCPSAQQHFHDSLLNLLLLVTEDSLTLSNKNLINSHHQCFCYGALLLLFLRPPCLRTHKCYRIWFLLSWGDFKTEQRKSESREGENEYLCEVLVSVCRSQGSQDHCLCFLRSEALTNQYAASGPHETRVFQCAQWTLIAQRAPCHTKLLPAQFSAWKLVRGRHKRDLLSSQISTTGQIHNIYICTNRCSSVRENLNWSQWLGEYVLIRILDSFPVFDAGKQEAPMKKWAISFIWYYLIVNSSDGPALFLSYVSKTSATRKVEINGSFFFFYLMSLLFNPPDLVAVLLSRCRHSYKDVIFLLFSFLSCLTSTKTC